jgi:hypothetical protein
MKNPAPKDATWQVSEVPPGSLKTVACMKRSGKMNRLCKVGTLNSGGPECDPLAAVRWPEAIGDRPQEDANRIFRESDPPIVVRDGNAGHKAKERAGCNASRGTSTGHEYSQSGVKLPACKGSWFWHFVSALVPCARIPEEPGAVIPHAGICEGGTGQPVSLPQSTNDKLITGRMDFRRFSIPP